MIKFDDFLKEACKKENMWSKDVDTHYDPPEGLFNKSAEEIAKQLKKDSKDMHQAMSRAMFYYNRAGDNEPESNRIAVVNAIHKCYKSE